MKNILLTEAQIIQLTEFLSEAERKTTSHSWGDKILSIAEYEEQLRSVGLTLFASEDCLSDLYEIASIIDNQINGSKKKREIINNIVLDYSLYSDTEAYNFVSAKLNGTQVGINKYADALSKLATPTIADKEAYRQAKKYNKMSYTDKLIQSNTAAKEQRFEELFKEYHLDALNFYTNWKEDDFPVDISNCVSPEQANEVLMPYFEDEPEYQKYIAIVNLCNKYKIFVYNGDCIFFPCPSGKVNLNKEKGTVSGMENRPVGLAEIRKVLNNSHYKCECLHFMGETAKERILFYKVLRLQQ